MAVPRQPIGTCLPYLQRKLLGEFWHIGSPCLLLVQRHDHKVLKELPLLVLDEIPVKRGVARGLLQAGLHIDQALAVGCGEKEAAGLTRLICQCGTAQGFTDYAIPSFRAFSNPESFHI